LSGAAAALLVLTSAGATPRPVDAVTENWPDVFDPAILRTLNIEMSEQDWDFVRRDLTETYRSAWLSADGETPILVAIRRKSSRALPSESNPIKVGLKVDINEYVDDQTWHGLAKLSLENGNGPGVVGEGLAWAMHRLAGETYGFPVAFANWVRLNVNGSYIGLYTSVEQRDKQALRQRGLWEGDETWLYEQDGGGLILDEGDPHSPAVGHLCYLPFQPKKGSCAIPDDSALEADLRAWIEMDNFLAQCAVEALTDNHDALCSHGKNTFFVDFSAARIALEERKRFYMPWDMDSVFKNPNANIYGVRSGRRLYQDPYEKVILNHPVFRVEYNEKLLALTDPTAGVLSEAGLHAFLDQAESLLGPALAEDPYPTHEAGTDPFEQLRSWLTERIASARSQATANTNPSPRP
jgi:hypothetical protein